MKEKKNINFFKRLKIAIFNLDEYSMFINEALKVSIKYMFMIIILSSLILSFVTTYQMSKEVRKGIKYLENEFPDFYFSNNSLKMYEYVEGYDKEFDVKIIADASEDIGQDKIAEYIKKSNDASLAFIVLNNKIIFRNHDIQQELEYSYLDSVIGIKDSTKLDILNKYRNIGGDVSVLVTEYFITTIIYFLENIIEVALYTLLVAMVGVIIGRICGINMRYDVAVTLSIYSLTVSTLCSLVYGIVYNIFGFEIQYFSAMYLIIAYVYIIAAVLILKTDLMKNTQDLMRIKSVEEQIKDELEKRKLEKQNTDEENEEDPEDPEDKEDNKKDKPESKLKKPDIEPDGSEV